MDTMEELFKCTWPDCKEIRIFTQKSAFSKHMDKHTRSYICLNPSCGGINFSDKAGLLQHERDKHELRKYFCPVLTCTRNRLGFARERNMESHMKARHGSIASNIKGVINSPKNIGSQEFMDKDQTMTEETRVLGDMPGLRTKLTSFSYELLQYIVGFLSFDDTWSLSQTCKQFEYLHVEEHMCKFIIQNKIRYSNEALAAMKSGSGNARALRRAAKRHDSLATATPFMVATIGFCDAFLYCKGVLCYTLDDRVRILDLHGSAKSELVINIPRLLTQALPAIGENIRGVFLILYYSDHIISCLYKTEGLDSTAWLIAFHLKGVILAVQELQSTDKIFVRHNKQFLYYGTHSEIGTDGYKKWVISGYEFKTRKWFPQKVYLLDMVGSEIGSTICFEFYEGFFYALSNQTSFEVEEIDWTSFYHCIRFPLNSPCKDLLQKTENKSMWRRQHQEGPIDDRWTSLRLDIDESTGKLRIVEARKEWYLGSSRSQRTYYTTDIKFPPPKDASNNLSETATSSCESSSPSSDTSTSRSSSSSASTASTSTSIDSQADSLPDVPLLRLLAKDDRPHHLAVSARIPENTHPGDDGSTKPAFTLAKSRIRTYHTSCSTFLDLVDDPLPDDWQGIQRLRLRAGTRRLGPPLLDSNRLLRSPSADLDIALAEMYIVPDITFWPPPQHLNPENQDEDIQKIYRLLNPPSHLGNVEGIADERSLVYVTGGGNEPQALIFVSFDPAIKLEGLKKWDGLCRKGAKGYGFGFESGDENEKRKDKSVYVDVGEADRTVSIDRKGKGKVRVQHAAVTVGGVGGGDGASIGGYKWAWKEKSMYQDINLGFDFGLDRPSES